MTRNSRRIAPTAVGNILVDLGRLYPVSVGAKGQRLLQASRATLRVALLVGSGGMPCGVGNTAKNTTLMPSVHGAGHRTTVVTAIAQQRPPV